MAPGPSGSVEGPAPTPEKQTPTAFAPFEQAGIPLEDQFRNWSELNVDPLSARPEDPYTLVRFILMNGAEVEAALFAPHFPTDRQP